MGITIRLLIIYNGELKSNLINLVVLYNHVFVLEDRYYDYHFVVSCESEYAHVCISPLVHKRHFIRKKNPIKAR